MVEGDKLYALLKHGASIHIISQELSIDYYGVLELSEEEQTAGKPAGALAARLDIPVGKLVDTPSAGQMLQCHLTGAGCVYHFDVPYRSASPLPDTIWYLDLPESAERIQLRDFVRVPIPMSIEVKLPGDHGSLKDYREVALIDISGGGLCFVHNEPLIMEAPIVVRVPDLPHIGTLDAEGTVRRATPIETNLGMTYHIGVMFGDALGRRERDRLVQSVYQLQQSYLRKGLKVPQIDHTKRG
ncbi:PilZ domain-containing protein [uncultured Selenomonas sp.]|uniref:flagellar brake protein n=1 Tax=uncultured Selenomonas sp. TaxID=159275 RepID=UPI0028E960DC|nr:PilZ domain-containing protein [uncultured Selenomonas sp.]